MGIEMILIAKRIMIMLGVFARTVVGIILPVLQQAARYRKKNYIVFNELLGVILICVGIAMIYLPLSFIIGGIAVLILTQAEENK